MLLRCSCRDSLHFKQSLNEKMKKPATSTTEKRKLKHEYNINESYRDTRIGICGKDFPI